MDSIGLYDPETLELPAIERTEMRQALEAAFGCELLLCFAQEAWMAGDEYRITYDRFGRTLTQPSIIRVEVIG